ncbi:MAG: PhzF family phenazine biosynthesis protein [bacterium]|nr:PhzF family phenazine biosynthesis protein [bacterium]
MNIPIKLIKSFSQNRDAGNPAGVVIDANNLTDNQILQITRDLGFGESAFLQKSDKADYKIRLFSVEGEVNVCVTATIAAAFVIGNITNLERITFETKLGVRNIDRKKDGLILLEQVKPNFFNTKIDRNKIAKLLSVPEDSFLDYPMVIGDAGTPKLIIPMKSLDSLFAIKPDLKGISEYCKETGAQGFYPFSLETKKSDSDFHARQFNPLAGIDEDPVTGIAAAVLAQYLKDYHIIEKSSLVGEQGYIINKPGEIVIEMTDSELWVGGYAVEYEDKTIEL